MKGTQKALKSHSDPRTANSFHVACPGHKQDPNLPCEIPLNPPLPTPLYTLPSWLHKSVVLMLPKFQSLSNSSKQQQPRPENFTGQEKRWKRSWQMGKKTRGKGKGKGKGRREIKCKRKTWNVKQNQLRQ